MCGIAGIISSNTNHNLNSVRLKKMINEISFRGPDDLGIWINKKGNVYLAHARLSIIDLSKNANQPMISKDSRFVITYNGEIYNHQELRNEIENKFKVHWRSSSDTETLIKLIEIYGVRKTLKKIKGMFSFGCYDKKLSILYLCRDKYGEKPLYYGSINGDFYFSSDLKSLIENNKNLQLDHESINYFLKYSYIPSPKSIFKNIYKLDAGGILEFDVSKFLKQNKSYYNCTKWFDLNFEVNQSKNKQLDNFEYCSDLIENKIFESVKSQLISDVPVGCFLSGGIDSTLIAIALKNVSNKKIETFSIGFDNKIYDESKKSSKISKILGLKNNTLMMREEDLIDLIDDLPEIYSEPFGDSSSLPSVLLSKFSRKKVKVCLSGDGGDELFGGYNRYNLTDNIWRGLNIIPKGFKKVLRNYLKNLNSEKKNLISNLFLNNFSEKNQKLEKFFDILDSGSKLDLYKNILIKSRDSLNLMEINDDKDIILNNFNNFNSFKENMMFNDLSYYLQDDILCKVDRASMYHGLETRVPFLDIDILRASWRIPIKFKKNKMVLRHIINKYLNYNEIEGPKKGFSIPLKKWLYENLRHKIDKYINDEILKKYSFLKKNKIIQLWTEFKSKKTINEHLIWNIFILIQWLEKYKNNIKT